MITKEQYKDAYGRFRGLATGQTALVVMNPSARAAAAVLKLRTTVHDALAEDINFPGDPLWIQKSLSRHRRVAFSLYRMRLPK